MCFSFNFLHDFSFTLSTRVNKQTLSIVYCNWGERLKLPAPFAIGYRTNVKMGDVLPLCDSPLRSIVMVPYQKGKRSLKVAVSILKMIRIPIVSDKASPQEIDPSHPYKRLSGNLIVGNDWWWVLFSFIPFVCTWMCFCLFAEHPDIVTYMIFFFGLVTFHAVALHSVLYWHREMSPFRLIGDKAKFMIEVIPMIVAAALRHLLVFDGAYYALLISCTTYFYTFVHFMHAAYDIGGKDVFLGLSMVVLVHRLNEELLVGALALILCLGLSLYRYLTYCAPELPIHPKKEMELPC